MTRVSSILSLQFHNIPNRDHMRAVGDRVYKAGVLEFLSHRK
jgi:hypothetical protein